MLDSNATLSQPSPVLDGMSEAAQAIYDACFTLAPIPFEEAKRRGTLHYRRAVAAAERACDCLIRSGRATC